MPTKLINTKVSAESDILLREIHVMAGVLSSLGCVYLPTCPAMAL